MPLVPSIALYACVLGNPRNRWDPGNLLVSTIGSGLGAVPSDYHALLQRFRDALTVQENDDLFARFLEVSLSSISDKHYNPLDINPIEPKAPAWRISMAFGEQQLTPAERFCQDLDALLILKNRLTRRQWTVLLEALLRVGLTCHELWLCQLAHQIWFKALNAL